MLCHAVLSCTRLPACLTACLQFYTMDCLGCGNLQAQKMGVDESRLGGM
jgi:hypothetical protein